MERVEYDMKRLNFLIESVPSSEAGVNSATFPDLITLSREELKICIAMILEEGMLYGGGFSQLADKCVSLLEKRALYISELKNHDV